MTNGWMRLAAGCVLLALTAAQCQRPQDAGVGTAADGTLQVGTAEATEALERGVSPGGRTLVLDGFQGDVAITGSPASTAKLTFTKRGRAGDPSAAGELLGDISITESGTAEAYTYRMESDTEERTAVDVRGTVPRATELRVEKNSGGVAVDSVTGPITVRQQYGNVHVGGAAAAVDVSVQTGDVEVGFRALPSDAKVSVRSANGDLTLTLPPDASVQVDAQTNAGAVRTEGLSFGPQRLTPANAGARYTAQMGGGASVVELRTENGVITLRAGAPTSMPDTTAPASSTPDTTETDTTGAAPTGPTTTPPDTTAPDRTPAPTTRSAPNRDTDTASPSESDTTSAPPSPDETPADTTSDGTNTP